METTFRVYTWENLRTWHILQVLLPKARATCPKDHVVLVKAHLPDLTYTFGKLNKSYQSFLCSPWRSPLPSRHTPWEWGSLELYTFLGRATRPRCTNTHRLSQGGQVWIWLFFPHCCLSRHLSPGHPYNSGQEFQNITEHYDGTRKDPTLTVLRASGRPLAMTPYSLGHSVQLLC